MAFEREGYAKNYLQINQEWRDHVLTALTTRPFFPKDNGEYTLK